MTDSERIHMQAQHIPNIFSEQSLTSLSYGSSPLFSFSITYYLKVNYFTTGVGFTCSNMKSNPVYIFDALRNYYEPRKNQT